MRNTKLNEADIDRQLRAWSAEPIAPEVARRLEWAISSVGSQVSLRPAARRAPRLWFAIASAAVVLWMIGVGWLPIREGAAWAQVVRAVAAEPWMRLTLHLPSPQQPETRDPALVVWLSGDRRIAALDPSTDKFWLDLSTGEKWVFASTEGQIQHGVINRTDLENAQVVAALLNRFEAPLPNQSAGLKLIEQQTDTAVAMGRTWDRFTFVFDSATAPKLQTYVLLVDPQTRRPVEMDVFYGNRAESKPLRFAIDYPKSGPRDIYDLGVPRSTPVVESGRSD